LGDWHVAGRETYDNATLAAHGDVILEPGSTLELVNSVLRMELPPPAEPQLIVQDGARLYLNGSSERRAIITDGEYDQEGGPYGAGTDFHYRILVERGALMAGTRCSVTNTGVHQEMDHPPLTPGPRDGFRVRGSLELTDCIVNESRFGIVNEGGSVRLQSVVAEANWGDFQAEGGSISIVGSHFTSTWSISGTSAFLVSDSSFVAGEHGSLNGIGATSEAGVTVPARGKLSNVSIQDYSSCLVVGPSNVTLSGARFSNCGIGLEVQAAQLFAENVRIEGSRMTGDAGALVLRSGHVVLQNATISKSSGNDILISGDGDLLLRNVSWDRGKLRSDSGGNFAVRVEGLLEVRVFVASGRAPGGVSIVADNPQTGVVLEALTDSHGVARLWLPVANYGRDGWAQSPIQWNVRTDPNGDSSRMTVDVGDGTATVDLQLNHGEKTPAQPTWWLWVVLLVASLALARQKA
jgi:hypothetical protein